MSSTPRSRGVYPTPPPLVSWMVRAIHHLLQDRFSCSGGLADPEIRLLDPAAGPLNFILPAWQLALDHDRVGGGKAAELLANHLLPHTHGIEILPDACRRGRQALREFLAPFLPFGPIEERLLVCGDALGGPAAGELIADGLPVLLCNPPWIGFTPHRGAWISTLLQGYELPGGRTDPGCYQVEGLPLGERNPKWIQDDCIKFLRLAQWIVERHGAGIIAFVINHNPLDAPTLRGFRFSLLQAFEEIWALDLHGNRRKGLRDPDDQNLCPGVRQGAAVLLLLKRPGLTRRIVRADLVGSRASKLEALAGDLASLPWKEIRPRAPLFLLAPSAEERIESEYLRGVAIPQIFHNHSSGVITGNDHLFTHTDRRSLEQSLLKAGRTDWLPHLTVFLARPFDLRYIVYLPQVLARPRLGIMRHLRMPNIALVVPRLQKSGAGALVTSWVTGHKVVSHYDINFLFPLYLYSEEGEPRSNLSLRLVDALGHQYGRPVGPEEIFSYTYALLQAPLYRGRYAVLLAHGFPRISFPQNLEAFEELATRGRELIRLHLFLDGHSASHTLPLAGDLTLPLAEPFYTAEGTVALHPRGLWLERIPPEVWGYRIGGYAVLAHWLHARRGRRLQPRDLQEISALVHALDLTLQIQDALDPLFRRAADDAFDIAVNSNA
jgi:predicted helicase